MKNRMPLLEPGRGIQEQGRGLLVPGVRRPKRKTWGRAVPTPDFGRP